MGEGGEALSPSLSGWQKPRRQTRAKLEAALSCTPSQARESWLSIIISWSLLFFSSSSAAQLPQPELIMLQLSSTINRLLISTPNFYYFAPSFTFFIHSFIHSLIHPHQGCCLLIFLLFLPLTNFSRTLLSLKEVLAGGGGSFQEEEWARCWQPKKAMSIYYHHRHG